MPWFISEEEDNSGTHVSDVTNKYLQPKGHPCFATGQLAEIFLFIQPWSCCFPQLYCFFLTLGHRMRQWMFSISLWHVFFCLASGTDTDRSWACTTKSFSRHKWKISIMKEAWVDFKLFCTKLHRSLKSIFHDFCLFC